MAGSEPPATRGFAGHDDDDGTTLVDMGGRVYSPKIGAFTDLDAFRAAENINVDLPIVGMPYRVMVNYFGGSPATADPRGRGGSSGSSSNAAPGTGTGPVRGERSNETGAVPLSATGGGEAKNTLAGAQGAVQAGALQVAGFVGGFVFSQVGLDGVIDVKPELDTAFSIGAVGGHVVGLGLAAGAIITGGSIAVGSVGAGGVLEIASFGGGTPIVVPAAAAGVAAGSALATAGILAGVGHVAGVISATNRLNASRSGGYPSDRATPRTRNRSSRYASERDARSHARTRMGHDPVQIEPGKMRSRDGRWQYRGNERDLAGHNGGSPHIHIERLDPVTGEVLENWHLQWN